MQYLTKINSAVIEIDFNNMYSRMKIECLMVKSKLKTSATQ